MKIFIEMTIGSYIWEGLELFFFLLTLWYSFSTP